MTEKEYWEKIEHFFQTHFDMEPHPPVENMLFLIGVQEVGSGKQEYSKDDKVNLLHVAVCRLLQPYGYYRFAGFDADGWPRYEELESVPQLKPNEQTLLMKKAIIQYFMDEGLLNEQ